jgi:predicted CXXCH cytochrome family protein
VLLYTFGVPRIVVLLWLATAMGGGLTAAPALEDSYIDAGVCATCHAAAARNYQQTGMGRSFFRPGSANTVEDYAGKSEFHHERSDTQYAMVRRDGAFYQRRWTPGFGGKPANVEELRIDYVIGSGNHSRTYLHRTARGTLIELPLSWYSEKGGYWHMSPGFDSPRPPTRRLVSYDCMFCHNGYPRIPAGHDAPGSEPIFSGDLPQGIDCQRCHGPGARHVEAARTGGDAARVRASIVNPAKLPAKARMDVCLQCHLEPTSTAIPSLVRRFDRGPFSYRPGEALSAFRLAFDHVPGKGRDDKFEIVGSSAYRLRQSRCFVASKEALACDTCHNPHRAATQEQYAAVCRGCHGSALESKTASGVHPAGADCVGCHMPKRRTDDVVHVVMTDHRIQRRPPARDLLAEMPERHDADEYRDEVVPYDPPALSRSGVDALYRAFAQVALKNNLKAGVAELGRLMTAQQPRDPEWHIQLGDARLANGEVRAAIASYERATQLAPKMTRALQGLAKGLRESGQPGPAADLLRKAVQIAPEDGGSWYQLGVVEADLGRNGEAIEKLRKAMSLDPDLPGVQTTLARVQLAAGQVDAAEAMVREALRIDPYESSAWDLAGRILTTKKEFPEAFFSFERAIRQRPGFAPHLYDYALALSAANEFERSEQQVRTALKADAGMAESHALLGGLLARRRELEGAAASFQEAVRLRPELARTRLDLASTLAALGRTKEAVEQLREVAKSSDAEAAKVAVEALRRFGQ